MNKIWKYVVLGIFVALGGLYFSGLSGSFFNGMEYGSACVLGICMYLCAVVVICAGAVLIRLMAVLRKLDIRPEGEEPEAEGKEE